jgi:hypothetical protein
MNLHFIFDGLKPISANHYKGRTKSGRTCVKKEAVDFKASIGSELFAKIHKVNLFEAEFNTKTDYIALDVMFFVPKDKFLNKKGEISKRSIDLDNCLKVFIDGVFDSFEKLDDKYVAKISAVKLVSPNSDYSIELRLTKHSYEDLLVLSN